MKKYKWVRRILLYSLLIYVIHEEDYKIFLYTTSITER